MTVATTHLTKNVELATGVRLPYAEQGDAAGVPMVLLHGVTDSWHSFEGVLTSLPPSIRAFALTQRGHGDADRPATGYGVADFSADLAAFMDALALDSAVVVGHSMGSSVAQRFALDNPDRVRGLVLIGSFVEFANNPAVVEFEAAVSQLEDPIDPGFVREFQQSTIARPVPPAFLETVVAESLKVPARVWREAFAGFLTIEVAAQLARIAAPTLVAWGDRDAFSPRADQETLATAIAGARLAVYPGLGHSVH